MSHRVSRLGVACAALVLLPAQAAHVQQGARATAGLAAFLDIAAPAAAGAAQPNVAVDRAGRIWLSWLEPRAAGGFAFRAAALRGASFDRPVTIAEGPNLLANWADFPSIFAAADGTLAAHWLERAGSRAAYGVRLRTSRDAGRTWSEPLTPHRDASLVEHGFVSFFDAPEGGVGLTWLDGRQMAGHPGADHGAGSMTLRATTVTGAALGEDVLIDDRVCDCCQTAAARTADGVVMAYRDRSAPAAGQPEIRDIAVVRHSAGNWSAPVMVHDDNWELSGCPVNGPAVAAAGNNVAIAWFSEAASTPRVQAAFSRDGGRTFSAPVRLDARTTLGRVDVVMPAADRALVSFIERTEGGAELVVREIRRDGTSSRAWPVSSVSRDRASGFARMAIAGSRLVVAWTDVQPNAPTRVRVAAAPISSQ